MAVDLELAPKHKRPAGEPCCEPVVYPDIERAGAERMAAVAKALGDPVRMQLVDVLRKHAGKVCVCELVPLFDLSQPTVSHHLKVLRDAGAVTSERRGNWVYYRIAPNLIDRLSGVARTLVPGGIFPAEAMLSAWASRSATTRSGPTAPA